LTRIRRVCLLIAGLALGPACDSLSDFSTTSGGVYFGAVTGAGFVRAGLGDSVRMCLELDTSQLQSAPGSLTTDDGLFRKTPLRQIPQLWHDPLSTLTFGQGRTQNLLYVAQGNATHTESAGDVFVVVSLMTSGNVEVRLLRGAPQTSATPSSLFGVFTLSRQESACPF
jgi:hypothetical protein